MKEADLIKKICEGKSRAYPGIIGDNQILNGVVRRYKELRAKDDTTYCANEDMANQGFSRCESLFFQAISDVMENVDFMKRNLFRK